MLATIKIEIFKFQCFHLFSLSYCDNNYVLSTMIIILYIRYTIHLYTYNKRELHIMYVPGHIIQLLFTAHNSLVALPPVTSTSTRKQQGDGLLRVSTILADPLFSSTTYVE